MENPEVDVVALADVVRAKGLAFARRYGIPKFYERAEMLFRDGKVEAVYITSPPKFHASQVLEALEAGKHVFSEKPPAINLKEAERLIEAVEESGLTYQVGFNRRFWPVYKRLKGFVDSGRLKPFVVDIKMVRGEMERPSWTKVREVAGGFLYDSVIHMLDLSRWIFGEPKIVRCLARRSIYPHLDGFVILLELLNEERTILSITSAGHASWVYPFERVEVYGDHCSAITEESLRLIFAWGKGDIPNVETYQFFRLPEHVAWGFKEEDELFIRAITEGFKPPVTVEDAYKAVELIDACYSSAEQNGKPITLSH